MSVAENDESLKMGHGYESKPVQPVLQELRKQTENSICFICGSISPTYVASDFLVFICVMCSGIHRELGFRVKSISMSKWTEQEVKDLAQAGNMVGKAKWLGKPWAPQSPKSNDLHELKDFIKRVFVEKEWYVEDAEVEKKEKKRRKSHSRGNSASGGRSRSSSKGKHRPKQKSGALKIPGLERDVADISGEEKQTLTADLSARAVTAFTKKRFDEASALYGYIAKLNPENDVWIKKQSNVENLAANHRKIRADAQKKRGDEEKYWNNSTMRPEDEEVLKYSNIFHKKARDGFVSADTVYQYFESQGIKGAVVNSIWKLADMDNDFQLDREEFIIAHHLITKHRENTGMPLPRTLPKIMNIKPEAEILPGSEFNPELGPGITKKRKKSRSRAKQKVKSGSPSAGDIPDGGMDCPFPAAPVPQQNGAFPSPPSSGKDTKLFRFSSSAFGAFANIDFGEKNNDNKPKVLGEPDMQPMPVKPEPHSGGSGKANRGNQAFPNEPKLSRQLSNDDDGMFSEIAERKLNPPKPKPEVSDGFAAFDQDFGEPFEPPSIRNAAFDDPTTQQLREELQNFAKTRELERNNLVGTHRVEITRLQDEITRQQQQHELQLLEQDKSHREKLKLLQLAILGSQAQELKSNYDSESTSIVRLKSEIRELRLQLKSEREDNSREAPFATEGAPSVDETPESEHGEEKASPDVKNLKHTQQKLAEAIEKEKASENCKLCSKNKRDTILLNCGHFLYCDSCVADKDTCPSCDQNIVNRKRVFG